MTAVILLALASGLLAAGCGPNNPGEPRTPAERLSAPNLGSVSVYCVERDDVPVTTCSVGLDADRGHSRAELRDWWLRAARALRGAGAFDFQDGTWRFGLVDITEPTSRHHRSLGWRCRGDDEVSPRQTAVRMDARNPGDANGIKTLAAARRAGCKFGPYRAPYDSDN
jgi:hypothetical protein